LVASIVNALKVPAAGVQAQPLPKLDVPISCGADGVVTSRYCSETASELVIGVLVYWLPSANRREPGAGRMFQTVPEMLRVPASAGDLGSVRS
jgi:hypothetical protein